MNFDLNYRFLKNRAMWIGVTLVFMILVTGCSPANATPSNGSGQEIPVNTSPTQTGGSTNMSTTPTQVPFSLSEGKPQPAATAAVVPVSSEPLTDSEIEQILGRLPTLAADAQSQVDFKLPLDPIPPPLTGNTQSQPFPPAEAATQPAAEPASGPLEVLRYAPEGEVSIAPFVSVTFNQPMVPLSTVSDLAAQDVPVQILPPLPGTWRWAGTKTLTFEYDSKLIDRLPKATEYRVFIPAGTKSATGGVLVKTVEWTFSTPPVVMTAHFPGDVPQPQTPLFFASFDQRIDPSSVLKTIQVTAGGTPVELVLANDAEVNANDQVKGLVKNAVEGRWLVFRAASPLPLDSAVNVTVGPGTPSAEGPLPSKAAQTFSFRTYAALKVVDHGCSWAANACRPLSPFFIRFNNNLDPNFFQEGYLKITPDLAGVNANIYGNTISIQGATRGQTTYTVVVSGEVKDIFGQKLGHDESLTFQVGKSDPGLVGPSQPFITLDPASKSTVFSVYAINFAQLDVQVYSVQPSDWPDFKTYLRNYQRTDAKINIPGKQVLNKTIAVDAPADTLKQVDIDLKPFLQGQSGQFIVIVKPHKGLLDFNKYWQVAQAWVQVTQIGLDAFVDHSSMLAWTTALKDGSPLSGVTISATGNSPEKTYLTGADGLARFDIPDGAQYLTATLGADTAILPQSANYWGDSGWARQSVNDELRWYVFDDRQMYKPGETVHVKGWIRRIGGKQDGDVTLVGDAVNSLRYRIVEPQGNEVDKGTLELNSLGGFDLTFTLPDKVNLGTASLILDANGTLSGLSNGETVHTFQIEEFRRPEFEVTARNETQGPYFAGGSAILAVEAKYYAGGALPNADVTWTVTSTPGSYSPPNWPDFTFGTWKPWWYFEPVVYDGIPGRPGGGKAQTFTGKTDASGTHYLNFDFEKNSEPGPVSISAQASVMDVNRQAWTGSTSLLVHPAALYIGLHSERYFVERGAPLKINYIVTDLDGKAAVGIPLEIQAARMEWKLQGGAWNQVAADTQKCSQTSAADPGSCTFETPVGGVYTITATVKDSVGRLNETRMDRWVSGGQLPPARKVEQEKVTLIPDKESYQPGDTAHILVQSPFSPAEGVMTVSRSGILYNQRFRIEDSSVTLDVPIEDKFIPNLEIQVDVAGAAKRVGDQGQTLPDLPERPAYASGELTLKIPATKRTLSLQVTPEQAELQPGKETSVNVVLKDADGKPVQGGEVAVAVVDEAVLALTQYKLTDPISIFYAQRPADLSSQYLRASIVLADPLALQQQLDASQLQPQSMADGGAMPAAPAAAAPAATNAPLMEKAALVDRSGNLLAQQQPAIALRTNFDPLAAFSPAVSTDASGQAIVKLKLPDNLTRYRIMAVAVYQGTQYGLAESNLVARLPLMVRPSAPRFLNFGDQFELPVVLQNQTDAPLVVSVALRSSNLNLTGTRGMRLTVPARDRVEVRFPAAAVKAGTAHVQVAAVSGDYSDAATVDLPVYTPATTEAFATYGVLDDGSLFQPVAQPKDVFPQYGGLEINTSSTALQALTDAVLYLVKYPYDCSEQMASRILGIAALRDVLTAFQAKDMPTPAQMEDSVNQDINTLQSLQNSDGGFPYWRHGQESVPFNTIHVAHALQRASLKGYKVPENMRQNVLQYLRDIETHYPTWYSQRTRSTLSAYALYVRNLMGDKDPQKARLLLTQNGLDKLDLEAVGWLWMVLHDDPQSTAKLQEIRTYINNRVVETAGAANFTSTYDDQTYLLLSSDRRADAILLDALMLDNPKGDLIPKIVNGLMAQRKAGRWESTQENVFILLALDTYFNTFESQTPQFVARFWLGDTYVANHAYAGRSTDRQETLIPMSYLTDGTITKNSGNLVISKEGPGRLYYRLGLSYAPTSLEMKALDMGFVVRRTYEAVDDPKDVVLDGSGIWQIKAGARVRVHITMVADTRRYHVALVDPLPAGLEMVNPDLAVSGSTPQDPTSPDYKYGWWWWGTWYEHQNLRDDRAEAFTSLLWDGVYQYTYIARATTPGRFVVPPAKAEEMYSPEVFGRSASNTVVVAP